MKKYLNISFIYALLALAGGVFYREVTKWNGFTGVTSLGKVHTHFFLLGMLLLLIVALFARDHDLSKQKLFRYFMIVYNIGLPLTAVMMVVRGIVQVLQIPLSLAMNASLSGIAGIGHICISVGLILLILSLKRIAIKEEEV